LTPLPLRLAAKLRQTLHLSTRKDCSDNRGHLSNLPLSRFPMVIARGFLTQ
jgi:hypothetical protein